MSDKVDDFSIIDNTQYIVYRSDRINNRNGGGTLILVKNSFCSRLIDSTEINGINYLLVSVLNIHILLVYVPPTQTKSETNISSLCNYLMNWVTEVQDIIILGDFNLPNLFSTNIIKLTTVDKLLTDLCNKLELSQLITFPTRNNHILDRMYTNRTDLITGIKQLPPFNNSDHLSFSFFLRLTSTLGVSKLLCGLILERLTLIP